MAETSNQTPSGEDLLRVIEQMDHNEVRNVYYRAIHAMQSRMHKEQGPFDK